MPDHFTFATGTNVSFLENMYESFQKSPEQLDDSWRRFFEGYEFALSAQSFGKPLTDTGTGQEHAKIEGFINTYRRLGHLYAHLDPLSSPPVPGKEMQPEAHGLGQVQAGQKFLPASFGNGEMTLQEIHDKLKKVYCHTIGADFREANRIDAVIWLQKQMESCDNQPVLPPEERIHILHKLSQAENFETFLQSRYLGQKRFSLEGLESLIPLLDTVITEAAENGTEELCMGMAHRGRLNVLANIIGKPYVHLLTEFEGSYVNPFDIDGDVKYHMGFANSVQTRHGKTVDLYLSPNPSHLEAVNPVVGGFIRSRQDQKIRSEDAFLNVLLHGDASFIGQGIVAETFNLSHLEDYRTGGTIHVITNNQIGFTTHPKNSRSCNYSSDIAKIVRAPVFHVNADHPESVVWVAKLATQYRNKFRDDVVIDLTGYRRHGHNETDEPTFTQPQMYKTIKSHKSVFRIYSDRLIEEGVISRKDHENLQAQDKMALQNAYEDVRKADYKLPAISWPEHLRDVFRYTKIPREEVMASVKTAVSEKQLQKTGARILSIPDHFNLHPKLKRIFQNRADMLKGSGSVDWAFAELLSFASLSEEGYRVRLSGQDCKRGTFSSRHGVLCDYITGQEFEPLNQGKPKSPVHIVNSPLSELGCLGFEFGYSVANKNALVLWEAQFGDFVNGAQIIIDQFISASESKWNLTSGLVLLLPHGFEGMGPEHSSARPERFLQQCGNINMQVCNVTTPAQYFHLLRRQMCRSFRKPLILMTPKSLLRHPLVRSPLKDFTKQCFQEVLDDQSINDPQQVEKLIFCTGKIYYELMEVRSCYEELSSTPVIRIEQLYPFPFERVRRLIAEKYNKVKNIVWVQEEPQNMGAWTFVRPRLREIFEREELHYLGRKHSGTTAEGSAKTHKIEQKRILEEAFGLVCAWTPQEQEKRFSRL